MAQADAASCRPAACRYEPWYHDGEVCAALTAADRCESPCGSGATHCPTSCAWEAGRCRANASDDRCCSAQMRSDGTAPDGCLRCSDGGECCQEGMGLQLNCSVWDRTPGVAGHLDHILLSTAQLLNDTGYSTSVRQTCCRLVCRVLVREASLWSGKSGKHVWPLVCRVRPRRSVSAA